MYVTCLIYFSEVRTQSIEYQIKDIFPQGNCTNKNGEMRLENAMIQEIDLLDLSNMSHRTSSKVDYMGNISTYYSLFH